MDENKAYELVKDVFGDPVEPVRKKQYKIICINPDCGDHSGNLEINLEKQIFHCWRCGYSGSMRKLLRDYLGSVPEEFNEDWYTKDDLKRFRSDYSPTLRADERFATLPEDFVSLWGMHKFSFVGRKALKYASERMTPEEIERYKVGYCGLGKYQYRIIVPTFEEGRVVYFIARDFIGHTKRYLNPEPAECNGITSGEVVFNLDRCRELGQVVICEGVFDAIRTGEDGSALFKSAISERQFFKLFDIPRKYIMLDSPKKDPQAPAKAVAIADYFQEWRKPVYLVIPPEGDPGESNRQDIRQWIAAAPLFTTRLRRSLVRQYPGIPNNPKIVRK